MLKYLLALLALCLVALGVVLYQRAHEYPTIELVTGSDRDKTLKGMRGPAGMGGSAPPPKTAAAKPKNGG